MLNNYNIYMTKSKQLLTQIVYNDNYDVRKVWMIPYHVISLPFKVILLVIGTAVNTIDYYIGGTNDDRYTDYDESWF